MSNFELITLRNGHRAVREKTSGEVMHPSVGPWDEANRLYVEQSKLSQRLQSDSTDPVVLYDVGLGAAANAVAALTCARDLGSLRRRPLQVWSFENDLESLHLAMDDAEVDFPFLGHWRKEAQTLLDAGEWTDGELTWKLLQGDFIDNLALAPAASIVFYDMYSPAYDPSFWAPSTFSRLRRQCEGESKPTEGTDLYTYSASTPARVALLLAGFFVGIGDSVGTKLQTTVASTVYENLERPLGPEFLTRWERSSAQAPHGEALPVNLRERLFNHPQFVGMLVS